MTRSSFVASPPPCRLPVSDRDREIHYIYECSAQPAFQVAVAACACACVSSRSISSSSSCSSSDDGILIGLYCEWGIVVVVTAFESCVNERSEDFLPSFPARGRYRCQVDRAAFLFNIDSFPSRTPIRCHPSLLRMIIRTC